MKKISLLLMSLVLAAGAVAQNTVPKPHVADISYWEEAWSGLGPEFYFTLVQDWDGNLVADDYTVEKEFDSEEWTTLDPDCVTWSIYLDDDQLYTFLPEEWAGITEPTTEIPYGFNSPGVANIGTIDESITLHFDGHFVINATENPFFTWRIGVQVHYTVDGVKNSSDIVYLEVFPKMKPATETTLTSFLADWSSPDNNVQHQGFIGYDLYVIDVATGDTTVIADIPALTHPVWWGQEPIPGRTYLVEGLTPGHTYRYYVVSKHNWSSSIIEIPSNVQEVTLPSLEAPVMLPADEDYVEPTAFMAEWTNETPAEYVTDYTLYVNGGSGEPTALLREGFAGVTATSDGTARIDTQLDTYCDNEGWTGTYVYQAGGGGLKFGNSSNGGGLTTPALDLTDCGGTVTVTINAKNYGTDNTTVTVSCGEVSQTIDLTGEAADYTVTLEGVTAAAGQQITITSSGSRQRWYLYDVNISVPGSGESYVFENITDMGYVVTDLTPGETYSYYVVANYTDGSSQTSNTQEVTLPMPAVPELIADPEALTMSANVGETATATFDIIGADLTGNVTVTLTDETGMFTVAPATVTIAEAEEGATVTVTYAPTLPGTHTATVTIASDGAESVTVALTGTATMTTTAPVMLPADEEYVEPTAFMAEWTDETNAAYVTDYTLYVNGTGGEPTALLREGFAGVTAETDGTARIDSSLDDYCDNEGWTGTYVYQAGGGGLKFGNSSNGGGLTTPALDLTDCGGTVTVTINAKNYGTDNTTVTVSCDDVSETIVLTGEADDYTVTLEGVTAAADQQITITSSGSRQRWYLYDVNISVPGEGESYVFKNITDMGYVVTDLTPGETYTYYVVANYIDGTSAQSNVEEVTLPEASHGYEIGDVNHDGFINVTDVTLLIAHLADETNNTICMICADVNGDGEYNVTDVTLLIGIVINQE